MAATTAAVISDGVALRAMTAADLPAAHGLSAEMRWPHRPVDWELALRHAEGLVAERDGQVVGTGLRWRWGPQQATIGLIIVSPACQGRRIGHRLMTALLEGLEGCSVLLQATSEGRGLYERLGFVRTGEIRQHQGIALPAPLIALSPGRRLRPTTEADLPALHALDAAARGMPRPALIDELFRDADATVVLDDDGRARGFAMLRRFGRGHAIGPVVASDAEGRAGADRAPGRAERRPLHAHRHRLRQRPDRMGGKPGPAARRRGDDHGARRPLAPDATRGSTPSSRRRWAEEAVKSPRPLRPPSGRSTRFRCGRSSSSRPTASAAGSGPKFFATKRPTSTSGSGPTSATRSRCATSPRGWRRPTWARSFPKLELLFSTGAGVDQFDLAALPPRVSLVRMVEPGIVQGMVEYVTHAVLDLHRDMPAYRRAQQQRQWQPLPVRTAAECRVGVLGPGLAGAGGADAAGRTRLRRRRLEPVAPRPARRALPCRRRRTATPSSHARRSSSACCR